MCSQLPQNLCSHIILPFIPMETKGEVGFQGIHALFLQLVGTQLIYETDTAPFLPHIEQDATPLLFNLRHRRSQLLSAIAAQRTERITRQTFRMHPTQDIPAITDFTFYQCDVMLSVQAAHKTVCAEVAVFCR